jgi:hypothetical protein
LTAIACCETFTWSRPEDRKVNGLRRFNERPLGELNSRLGCDGRDDLELRRDRAAFGESTELLSEILVTAEVDARAHFRSDDPGDIGDVGLTELGAGKVGARREGRVQLRELGVERLGCLPFKETR